MRYSNQETKNLATFIGYPESLEDINTIISRDGCLEAMPFFINEEVVIDMDCVEKKIARSEGRCNNKSMDSAFVALDADGNCSIVFVEYRFNYQSMKNLRAKDLRGKKKFSHKNLVDLGVTNFHNKYYYIFNDNLKEQARRYFRSLYPSMPNNFIPLTIIDLKTIFF